ncbi:hypothetical protein ABEB36_014668 [Hypothenemus hampei]|uniref:Uncharacterized protein n=1 Tax=Hypothenemus hampei TaxID=57062 RepID=A0ABD1E2H1_HYPHA
MANLSAHDKAVLECVFNPHLPVLNHENLEEEPLKDEEECTLEISTVNQMEIEAIETAERGNLQNGLDLLNKALEITPKKPSVYCNRAYIYQYMRKFQEAFNDLTLAIDLCSEKHKRTLCQAYCQRGVLHKRAERPELAKVDFEHAAELGSRFAKGQVDTKKYAYFQIAKYCFYSLWN